jgi:hypothetical protein
MAGFARPLAYPRQNWQSAFQAIAAAAQARSSGKRVKPNSFLTGLDKPRVLDSADRLPRLSDEPTRLLWTCSFGADTAKSVQVMAGLLFVTSPFAPVVARLPRRQLFRSSRWKLMRSFLALW